MAIFDQTHSKIIESTFSFPEFVPACIKSVYSICSFWDKVNFRVLWPDWHIHFWSCLPKKKFWSAFNFSESVHQHAKNQLFHLFILQIQSILVSRDQIAHVNFCEFVSQSKTWGCFVLLWRNNLFQNPAIWLDESILALYLGNKIFPNIKFVQEHNKQYTFSLLNKFNEN